MVAPGALQSTLDISDRHRPLRAHESSLKIQRRDDDGAVALRADDPAVEPMANEVIDGIEALRRHRT